MYTTDYELLYEQLEGLIGEERAALPALANFSALVFYGMEQLNWAGFYLMNGDRLLLGPFQGKHACVSIPIGKGVCGQAVKRREIIIVPNVHEFEGHIACDQSSNSEIVLPIIQNDTVLGVLDIDSPIVDRFSESDARGLSSLLELLIRKTDIAKLTSGCD